MAEFQEIVLGDLKIRLRLDDDSIDATVKRQKTLSDDLEKKWSGVGKKVGLAIAAVTAAVGAALGLALKRADDLGKAAQKIGIGVESLSRLEYAGRLADVSLDTLTQSIAKMNRNLAEVASGSGAAAKSAFDQLDISIKNTDGSLRSSDEVFADVSDRFARLEEGPRKTALAMDLFGRSGAQLIPLLNEGKAGLKELADEADRLGITIDQKTAAGAERFNDSLTRLWAGVQGVATRVGIALMPQLEKLADFFESEDFQKAVTSFAQAAVEALQVIGTVIVGLMNAAKDFYNYLNTRGNTKVLGVDEIAKQYADAQKIIDNPNSNSVAIERSLALQFQLDKELSLRKEVAAVPHGPTGRGGKRGDKPSDKPPEEEFELGGFATGPTEDEMADRLDVLRTALATEAELEATNFADRQAQLADFLEREIITKAEYDELFAKAEKEHWENIKEIRKEALTDLEKFNEMSFKDQAKTVFSELQSITEGVKNENDTLFNINKAAAVANAVINTYEGISKSLSAYPMPLAAIMAGVHAAAGFAQVTSILATTRNTTGGSAKGLSGAAGAADAATSTQGTNQDVMYVKGLNPNDLFTGSAIRGIAEGLMDYQRNGGTVVFVS